MVTLLAPGNRPATKSEYNYFRDNFDFLYNMKNQGLTFVPLELTTLRLILISYEPLANDVGLSSQLGYLILSMDGKVRANVVNYGSKKCKRI